MKEVDFLKSFTRISRNEASKEEINSLYKDLQKLTKGTNVEINFEDDSISKSEKLISIKDLWERINSSEPELTNIFESSVIIPQRQEPSFFNTYAPDESMQFITKAVGKTTLADISQELKSYENLFEAQIKEPNNQTLISNGELITLYRATNNKKYKKLMDERELNDDTEPMIVGGYASVEVIDREGHLITTEALEAAFKVFMQSFRTRNISISHTDIQVGFAMPVFINKRGEVFKSGVDDKGLYLISEVRPDSQIAERVRNGIISGEFKSYSIAGTATKKQSVTKNGRTYLQVDGLELLEIAVCSKPVNQESNFAIVKGEKGIENKDINLPGTYKIKLSPVEDSNTLDIKKEADFGHSRSVLDHLNKASRNIEDKTDKSPKAEAQENQGKGQLSPELITYSEDHKNGKNAKIMSEGISASLLGSVEKAVPVAAIVGAASSLLGGGDDSDEEKAMESGKREFTVDEAKKIGEKIGVNFKDIDIEQFRQGLAVELEHGKVNKKTNVTNDNMEETGKIALAHLLEKKDYYSALKDMEQGITKDATVALPIDQKANDDIENKIIEFFSDHPEPDDAEVHAFAISMKLSPEELEEEIYKLLTSQLEKMDMNSFASENATKDGIAAEANKKNLQILNRIVKKMSLNRISEEKPKDEVKEYEQEQKKNMKSATVYKKGLDGLDQFVKEHQANPPFEGAVFNEANHRWEKPNKTKSKYSFGDYEKMGNRMIERKKEIADLEAKLSSNKTGASKGDDVETIKGHGKVIQQIGDNLKIKLDNGKTFYADSKYGLIQKEVKTIPDYIIPQIVSRKGGNNLKKLDSFVKKTKKGGKK